MKAVYLKDKNGNKLVSVPYYRVGDLFLTTIATNPSSYLGGTWELFGPGRCLVCVDTSQSEFNSVKKTGGEKTHSLTIDEMPSHRHTASTNSTGAHTHNVKALSGSASGSGSCLESFGNGAPKTRTIRGAALSAGSHSHTVTVNDTGSGDAHNNLQPFITCYVWIRIA